MMNPEERETYFSVTVPVTGTLLASTKALAGMIICVPFIPTTVSRVLLLIGKVSMETEFFLKKSVVPE